MKAIRFLTYVCVFSAVYILVGMAIGQFNFTRMDFACLAAGCLGGELGLLYLGRRGRG